MALRESKIPYRCSFCRERLVIVPLDPSDYPRALILLRPYQCPHCFAPTTRPFAWIGRLPLIGRLFQSQLFSQPASRSGNLSGRDDRIVTPTTRRIAKIGRVVERIEKRIGGCLSKAGRAVWSVIWFVPGKLFGKRKRRHKSRWKSRR